MINIPMNCKGALERASISTINASRVSDALTADNIGILNTKKRTVSGGNPGTAARAAYPGNRTAMPAHSAPASASMRSVTSHGSQTSPSAAGIPVPRLQHPVLKGQKAALMSSRPSKVHACFGWNVLNQNCDVDVSAFLLNQSGKVIGDSWFIFYGQTESPDKSIRFIDNAGNDREMITIDFTKLNPTVNKIVFVMTINEAAARNLNFGMVKDAYIRIINPADQNELVSFRLTEYYTNIISMMIGELYQYNGTWKFNAVGNGLARDLAGVCEFYGVQVI